MKNNNFNTTVFKCRGKEYETIVNNGALEKMNYDWNSYNFIDKDYLFMSIREVGSDKMLSLATDGFHSDFIVIDLKTNEEIMEWDKILELSNNNKLYDGSNEYEVEYGNWFSLEYFKLMPLRKELKIKEDYNEFLKCNNIEEVDSCSCYLEAKNFEELLDSMISEYEKYYN